MNSLLTALLPSIMNALLTLLSPDVVKKGLDALFDAIENEVVKTENKIDDATVLPVVRKLRAALDVPDDDDIG